jgi:hypothetical protein
MLELAKKKAMSQPAKDQDWNEVEEKMLMQFASICEAIGYVFPPEFSYGQYMNLRNYFLKRTQEYEERNGSNN